MTPRLTQRPPGEQVDHTADTADAAGAEHSWKHWGLMILCCLPMVAILVLVMLGLWGAR